MRSYISCTQPPDLSQLGGGAGLVLVFGAVCRHLEDVRLFRGATSRLLAFTHNASDKNINVRDALTTYQSKIHRTCVNKRPRLINMATAISYVVCKKS